MLKKSLIIAGLFILAATFLVQAAQEIKFTTALRNCSPFSSNDNMQMLNTTVQSSKRISGRDGDKCVYSENVSFMGIESNVVCKFTQAQADELASVIDAYELVQQYSGEAPNFSSLDTAQTNPVSKVWGKYMQDSNVCTITTNQPE